jgi:transcriptional regulator
MIHVPEMFAERDEDRLFELIERNAFATMITQGGPEPWVSHLPFLLDRRRRVLRAHMARGNGHWKALESAAESLVIFHGPHHYVSPRWYDHHPSVPTWNYATVHVQGRARILADREEMRALLAELVRAVERGPGAWEMELPADYFNRMLSGIVGFEMPIAKLTGKFKLSQNRPPTDRPRVIAALQATGSDAGRELARLMRRDGERLTSK